MTNLNDYHALAAIALHIKPKRIFEIGTYRGVTSDFFLRLLPAAEVVSIAYLGSQSKLSAIARRVAVRAAAAVQLSVRMYNNSQLTREEVGSAVAASRRNRFNQIYGDSHKLAPKEFTQKFGTFDMVFIDGDHSAIGVSCDTELARRVLSHEGTICWHDANPKDRYLPVRRFLERMPLNAVATMDNYQGGIACWNSLIEERLKRLESGMQAPV